MTKPAGMALILHHKQKTSARVRFARFGNSMIAARLPLPAEEGVVPHPGPLLAAAAQRLQLPVGDLQLDTEFHADLLSEEGTLRVYLGSFVEIDPPFAALEAVGARFISLTELIGVPPTERDVMRLIYEHVLG